MKMTVRACALVALFLALGTGNVFGQMIWSVGAPNAHPQNGASNFDFLLNREGQRELIAPITLCATAAGAGGAIAAGQTNNGTFDVNDVFTMTLGASGGVNSPVLGTTTLGAANLQVVQAAAGTGVTATATIASVSPPLVPGAPAAFPVSVITITITGAPAAGSGINCITIANVRFDIGDTATGAVAGPPADGVTFGVVVTQIQEGFPATAAGLADNIPVGVPAGALGTGMPALTAANLGCTIVAAPAYPVCAGATGLGTAKSTLTAVGGNPGVSNPTGFTTGGSPLTAVPAKGNPANGAVASTVPSVVQNSGTTATGSISIQEGAFVAAAGALAINAPVAVGGGPLRGFVASGPDVTTFLNSSGATSGTTIIITVAGMPAGSSVTFASTAAPLGGAVLTMSGGGTITAPGGSVTYTTGVNEGTGSTGGTVVVGAAVGPSVTLSYTVSEPATGGLSGTGATFTIAVGPPAGGASPSYIANNLSDVFPSTVAGTAQLQLFQVSSNQTTKAYPYVLFTGGTTPSDYDTGVVLNNTSGQSPVVTNGVASYNAFITGQAGPFTVFFISNSAVVASVRSTAANFPGANLLSNGNLLQGNTWQALASQVLTAAGITGAFKGQMAIVTDFPGSNGFTFISQFTNASGGATMGYVVP